MLEVGVEAFSVTSVILPGVLGFVQGRLWRGRDKEADPAVNVTASELREEKILCQIAYCLRLLNLL